MLKKSQRGHRRSLKEKECLICKNKFNQKSPNQKCCGSIKDKFSCNFKNYLLTKKETDKKYRQKNRDKILKYRQNKLNEHYNIKWRHKLKFNYNELLIKQGNVCAICLKKETAKSRKNGKIKIKQLAVDHNHKTNTIRGLLCYRCNMGLGFFQENPIFLKKAIEYVENLG